MAGYDFLDDLLVVEVAQYGLDALGGHLADLGATVVKVEPPGRGDPTRTAGYKQVGATGESLLHLRWNRGKRSVALDLRDGDGKALFRRLAAQADVVVEGMRAGVLERLGVGYADLQAANPALVYCVISGMGMTGPYAAMASHGPAFDAFGAIGPDPDGGDVSLVGPAAQTPVGMHAVSLQAAVAVLAAVHRARRTGAGALLDVAAADVSAQWLPEKLDAALNPTAAVDRPGFADAAGRMRKWPRLDNYMTADGRPLLLMAHSDPAWAAFAAASGRPDLLAIYADGATDDADATCRRELLDLFRTRPRQAWLALLGEHGVPAIPSYRTDELIDDPHFKARGNTYELDHPKLGRLTLTSTPIKVPGVAFAPSVAPAVGEHSAAVLSERLGVGPAELAELVRHGVVATA